MRFTLLMLFLWVGAASAQTSYPMITHVTPVALERGKTTTVVVSGQQNFAGVYKALFEDSNVTAEVVPSKGKAAVVREVTLKVQVGKDTIPGVREFRVASNLGISSIGQCVISEHPVVQEKGDNNTREKANPVPVPSMVCGRIEAAEDVDYYRFRGKQGQTFTFEVLAARLQDKIHDLQKHADPILTLYDETGRELASNDDFYFADPLLSYTFTKDGEYVIQVRDSKYDGDPRWVYALRVTDRPHATHVYPLAARAGEKVDLTPVGSAARVQSQVSLIAPVTPGLQEMALPIGGSPTSPVPLLISTLPQVNEVEPNDLATQATRLTLPCGINGRIGVPRDVDYFRFSAQKGKALRFEVKARRFGTLLRSSLDSVLEVLSVQGAVLATNDDTFGKDAALTFVAPAEGDYLLRIRDLNNKGGDTFLYHLEADFARPDFVLRCDGDKAMIGPGSRTAWFVQVTRQNGFTGPVQVEVKGLPPGVTVPPLTIAPTQTEGVLVLSAASDAPRNAEHVEVIGTAKVGEEVLRRRAIAGQEIYFPGGGRGLFDVSMQTVAVTDPSDILNVDVKPTQLVLKPGQEVKLDVTLERKAGFDKSVTLDVLLRHLNRVYGNPLPKGVSIVEEKSKTLLGNTSKGHLVLRVAPDAPPVEQVPICVMAYVSINFVVKIGYSSPAILVSVRK